MLGIKRIKFNTYSERLYWLIRLRFILIILIMFIYFISISFKHSIILYKDSVYFIQINFIIFFLNVSLLVYQRYIETKKPLFIDEEHFNYLSFLHVDIDIIYIFLIILISNGIYSPFILLLTYNIVTITFLITGFKTYIYLLLLLILITFTKIQFNWCPLPPYFNLCYADIFPDMLYFSLTYMFAIYVSRYVSIKIFEKQDELNSLYEQTYKLSITDRLTGLYDQTYFRIAAQDALDIAKINNNKLAFVMLDLDNFKEFNDNNGHLSGSKALKEIASIMRKSFRKTDILAKYGGDEFIILMRDIDEEYIVPTLKRFQAKLLSHNFNPSNPNYNKITASIGVSLFPTDGDTIAELITKADKALYYIKNTGKNGLILFKDIKE